MTGLEQKRRVFGVREVTAWLNDTIHQFPALWVRGELSEVKPYGETYYLSLKEENTKLAVVFFRGGARVRQLGLQTGSEVEIFGNLALNERQSGYQLIVRQIELVGEGSFYQHYLQMKSKLSAEGLLDPARRRPIPDFPHTVGVITSLEGAAIKDFLRTIALKGHGYGLHLRIFPTQVQGATAADQMAAMVQYASSWNLCDLLVITRGGGSAEDLWPFNEEVLARAIAACQIPVISAVGHERDFSICDEVADLRCATPTAAAERVVEAPGQLGEQLTNLAGRMRGALQLRLAECRRRLENCLRCRELSHSEDLIEGRRVYVMQQQERLVQGVANLPRLRWQELSLQLQRLKMQGQQLVMHRRHRWESLAGKLAMLNPAGVLERGYSILLKQDGKAVRSPQEVKKDERLTARLSSGGIIVSVDEMIPEKEK